MNDPIPRLPCLDSFEPRHQNGELNAEFANGVCWGDNSQAIAGR
jgi:hypothetical protein